ncbi:MAG: alpha/beta fold hydrolase [Verrucomicrobiaceae bacterium]|nr:alpha/beta fold hydrolase [Verrucomicrobiaceae bacterium]
MNGADTAILALHGNLGSAEDWNILSLSGIRAVDLWEHSALSYREFADELAGSLSVGLERPVLAGYSLGGRLALSAMAMHPERWGGAVLLSAHPGLRRAEDRLARRVSDEEWAQRAREMPWSDFLLTWNQQTVFGDGPAAPTSGQIALEPRHEAIALAFENWSLGRQDDLRPALRSFRAPVLWITGEKDEKFTRLAAEMAEVFPDFQHVILPGCGHRVLAEQPDPVVRGIAERFGGG